MPEPAVRLFVGGHAGTVQGERALLAGDRMFSPLYSPPPMGDALPTALLDSGAFSRPPSQRPSHAGALEQQLAWEERARLAWGRADWRVAGLVSHDVLIDEQWSDTRRRKERWPADAGGGAVRETIAAARYLSEQRAAVAPRRLVLSLQGVDGPQYARCAAGVLEWARPGDWIGLGGWCILGRQRRLLATFWDAMRGTLPLVADVGIRHIHIFGVLWEPALAGLLWLCDQLGLTVSTDSTAPVLAGTWTDTRKSGARRPYWRDNVRWWVEHLANLRASRWYREPPTTARQLALMGMEAA